ncbi:hypothetical protein RJ639_020703 [Escallonia herrerae]|uniref:Uncharacterized protein n=1 Tax=Escallonia herrerae TaxID=1293975 RepID=A0AA88V439_9ASTE|nr:hypothetical protein RJ639_020703 [Escallonia herrerae]
MGEENFMKHIRIEDVRWLCSLSESELDLLISLKQMVLQRAKAIGHESLAKKFDLKMIRALGSVFQHGENSARSVGNEGGNSGDTYGGAKFFREFYASTDRGGSFRS